MSQLAHRVGGVLHGQDCEFRGLSIDTRSLAADDLFIALVGDRADGHQYLNVALDAGAAGALVSRPVPLELPQVEVPDVLVALQDYAVSWRRDWAGQALAVTGSNGKTTVKELLAGILSRSSEVLSTRGNLNNHIGLPLTLLRLRPEHDIAVLEMGANHAGEIARLCEMARPQVGVITQAGDAHLEGFGSRLGVARAKGELFAGLPNDGVAVINADDDHAPLWRELAGQRTQLTFGLSSGAQVTAIELRETAELSEFVLRLPNEDLDVSIPLPGRHNVLNALAAAAAAHAVGADGAQIAAGLAASRAVGGRLAQRPGPAGSLILDDSYNANPSSLAANLAVLAARPGQRWLVLGNMAELGPDAASLHFEAGRQAAELGIDRVYTLGELAAETARGFGGPGGCFDTPQALLEHLRPELAAGVTVLVKGSRSAQMERVVEPLVENC